MKHLRLFIALSIATMLGACNNGSKQQETTTDPDSIAMVTPDSALYGTIGEGTSMHVLELVTDDNKTLTFSIDADTTANVQGGIFAGDKVSVITGTTSDGAKCVLQMINLTTLMGKWVSIDRNFEIKADGEVVSAAKAESNPYTQWAMLNGQLLLGTDTFSVLSLASDSLHLENSKGVLPTSV